MKVNSDPVFKKMTSSEKNEAKNAGSYFSFVPLKIKTPMELLTFLISNQVWSAAHAASKVPALYQAWNAALVDASGIGGDDTAPNTSLDANTTGGGSTDVGGTGTGGSPYGDGVTIGDDEDITDDSDLENVGEGDAQQEKESEKESEKEELSEESEESEEVDPCEHCYASLSKVSEHEVEINKLEGHIASLTIDESIYAKDPWVGWISDAQSRIDYLSACINQNPPIEASEACKSCSDIDYVGMVPDPPDIPEAPAPEVVVPADDDNNGGSDSEVGGIDDGDDEEPAPSEDPVEEPVEDPVEPDVEPEEETTQNVYEEEEILPEITEEPDAPQPDEEIPVTNNIPPDKELIKAEGLLIDQPTITSVLEFKPIAGHGFNTPYDTTMTNDGNELAVTSAGRLLELQLQLRNMADSNLRSILNSLSGRSISIQNSHTLFGKLLTNFKNESSASNYLKDQSFPNSLSDITSNFYNYSQTAYTLELDAIGDKLDDALTGGTKNKKWTSLQLNSYFYFLLGKSILKNMTQSNIASVSSLLTDDNSSYEGMFDISNLNNAQLTSLLNVCGLDNDDIIDTATICNLFHNNLTPSENLLRIFKGIAVSGLGILPMFNNTNINASGILKINDSQYSHIDELLFNHDFTTNALGSKLLMSDSNPVSSIRSVIPFLGTIDQDHSTSTILDSSKKFLKANLYDNFNRSINDIKKSDREIGRLLSFVYAERAVARNIKCLHENDSITMTNPSQLPDFDRIGMLPLLRTYYYRPGEDVKNHTMGDISDFNVSRYLGDGFTYFFPYSQQVGAIGSALKSSSDYQDNDSIWRMGLPINGICFDVSTSAEYSAISNESNSSSHLFPSSESSIIVNVFDTPGNYPKAVYFNASWIDEIINQDNTNELNPNNLPFVFSNWYVNTSNLSDEEAIEQKKEIYSSALDRLDNYFESIINESISYFVADKGNLGYGSTYSGPNTSLTGRTSLIESFFDDLSDIFNDMNNFSSSKSDQNFNNAIFLNYLSYCAGSTDNSTKKEDAFTKLFLLMCQNLLEHTVNERSSGKSIYDDIRNTELNVATYMPSGMSSNSFSHTLDSREIPDLSDSNRRYDGDQNSTKIRTYSWSSKMRLPLIDRVFATWLKYCVPETKIADIDHDNDPPDDGPAIEDINFSGNNTEDWSGGINLGSDVNGFVAIDPSKGDSTDYMDTNAGRALIFNDSETGKKKSTSWNGSEIGSATRKWGYGQYVNGSEYGSPNFHGSVVGINKCFRQTMSTAGDYGAMNRIKNTFVKLLMDYTLSASKNYFPPDDNNLLGNSSYPDGDSKVSVDADNRSYGLNTNAFTVLYCLLSIIGKIAQHMPTEMLLGEGDKKDQYRTLHPRWDGLAAKAVMRGLINEKVNEGDVITFTDGTEIEFKDYHIEINEGIINLRNNFIDRMKEPQKGLLACLVFLDNIRSNIASAKSNESVSESANDVTNSFQDKMIDFMSKHNDIFSGGTFNIQQEILATANNIKLQTPARTNMLQPSGKCVSTYQAAKMIKFLSIPGRGFLTNEISLGSSDQNQSNKMIMSVSLPNGFISNFNATIYNDQISEDPTINADLGQQKTVVAITIYKKNLLYPDEVFYVPKRFIFDTTKFIFDNSDIIDRNIEMGSLSTVDTSTLSNSIFLQDPNQFMEEQILYHVGRSPSGGLDISYMNGRAIDILGNNTQEEVDTDSNHYDQSSATDTISTRITEYEHDLLKNIYQNHLTDHYLKMYVKTMMGIDIDEDVYVMNSKRDISLYTGNDPELEQSFISNFYTPMSSLLSTLNFLDDKSYIYEFNRIVSTAAKSNFFAPEKYLNRSVLPKSIDRTFTFLIDEGDFVPIRSEHPITEEGVNSSVQLNSLSGQSQTVGHTPGSLNLSGFNNVKDELEFARDTMFQYTCNISLLSEPDLNFHKIIDEGIIASDVQSDESSSRTVKAIASYLFKNK